MIELNACLSNLFPTPEEISSGTCTGEIKGTCVFTVSHQLICVEVPVTWSANATPGATFVQGNPAISWSL
jgi:hypothetical protein